MKKNVWITLLSILIILFFTFIIRFIIWDYVLNSKFFFLQLIGFGILVFSFVYFIVNLDKQKKEENFIQFRFLDERVIKFLLLVLFLISLFLPSYEYTHTVTDIESINYIHYFKSILAILSVSFLPGLCIYELVFPSNYLNDLFKVKSYIIKIVLFPLLSISYIGINVMILDLIFANSQVITIGLYIAVFTLFLISELMPYFKRERQSFKLKSRIDITFNNFIIIILSLGIMTISIGVALELEYLLPGDAWVGVSPAVYVGKDLISPLTFARDYAYPFFWGYIIFGYGKLSGIPFININSMLSPFCFLSIPLLFLVIRSLLLNYDEKYSVLATILVTMFGSFFMGISKGISIINFVSFFEFIYKSYSYFLLFMVLSLYIVIYKKRNAQLEKKDSKIEIKLLLLLSFFLVESYMIYMFPLLIGLALLFLFSIISSVKSSSNLFFSKFFIFTSIIFFSLDLVLNFSLTFLFNRKFFTIISRIKFLDFLTNLSNLPGFYIVLFVFIIVLGLTIFIESNLSYLTNLFKKFKRVISHNFEIDFKKIFFGLFLFIFSILLILDIAIPIMEITNESIILVYIHKLFYYIGIIGIISVYISIILYKKDKRLFYILASWIIFPIIFGSVLYYAYGINQIFLDSTFSISLDRAQYWLSRIWYHSIIPICILVSFGIIKLVNYFKYDGKKKKSFLNSNFIKFSFILIIIVFSSTGLLVHGARKINMERKVRDTEAHIIGWAAENVPENTNILIDSRYELWRGLETMAMRNANYIDYFLNNVNTNNITLLINQTKEQNYQYLIIHTHYLYIGIYNKSTTQIVRDLLIPQFFNKTIYTYRDIIVCTSPYYNNV